MSPVAHGLGDLRGVAQTCCLPYRRLAVCQAHHLRGPRHSTGTSTQNRLFPLITGRRKRSRRLPYPPEASAPFHSQPGRLQVCDTADKMSALLLRPSSNHYFTTSKVARISFAFLFLVEILVVFGVSPLVQRLSCSRPAFPLFFIKRTSVTTSAYTSPNPLSQALQ